ncbi:hypothetical protein [Rhizobium sp. L245/93]|uniref:hypothetical protein n=1 Tax=Rhizobium sp. L245/93 TaxID=2819998 RepID=UPI001ADA9628|nr:hypothetical protein [Rhizobium sp. L245/93]MBO9167813.1 hypothetical protein [Rhizobium sp. L245/93]
MLDPEPRQHFRRLLSCKASILDIFTSPVVGIDANRIGHSLRDRSEMLVAFHQCFFGNTLEGNGQPDKQILALVNAQSFDRGGGRAHLEFLQTCCGSVK